MQDFTTSFGDSAAQAAPLDRAAFIRRTYTLLALSIAAFVGVEAFLFLSGAAGVIFSLVAAGGSMSWLLVLGAFMGISFLANRWASSETSSTTQYLGLLLYIVAEAIIFVPLIAMAMYYTGDASVLIKSGIVTVGLFAGLTLTVFLTRTDFSFLGPILAIGGCVAFGFIIASAIFGFSLGSLFAFIMVAFAGTAILYQTSNVLHQYNTRQHVAAALALFAGIALLFWYILNIFSSRD
jgi:FtsH-binding integral membrane protein